MHLHDRRFELRASALGYTGDAIGAHGRICTGTSRVLSAPSLRWTTWANWCRARDFHPQPLRSERSVSCRWTNAAEIVNRKSQIVNEIGTPGRTLACNLRVRSAALHTLSYGSVKRRRKRKRKAEALFAALGTQGSSWNFSIRVPPPKWWVATVLPRALRFKRPLHRCNACNPWWPSARTRHEGGVEPPQPGL